MTDQSFRDLIREASKLLAPRQHVEGRLSGDVASIVFDKTGRAFGGVCIDTPVWGICAERAAASAAIAAGSYEFSKVVAVWRDPDTNLLHVLPPCGGCRQFLIDLNSAHSDLNVVLGPDAEETLANLLPHGEWPSPLDETY